MNRHDKAYKAYTEGKIDASTLGQLACHNYDDEIIETAIERDWITEEVAALLRGREEKKYIYTEKGAAVMSFIYPSIKAGDTYDRPVSNATLKKYAKAGYLAEVITSEERNTL